MSLYRLQYIVAHKLYMFVQYNHSLYTYSSNVIMCSCVGPYWNPCPLPPRHLVENREFSKWKSGNLPVETRFSWWKVEVKSFVGGGSGSGKMLKIAGGIGKIFKQIFNKIKSPPPAVSVSF